MPPVVPPSPLPSLLTLLVSLPGPRPTGLVINPGDFAQYASYQHLVRHIDPVTQREDLARGLVGVLYEKEGGAPIELRGSWRIPAGMVLLLLRENEGLDRVFDELEPRLVAWYERPTPALELPPQTVFVYATLEDAFREAICRRFGTTVLNALMRDANDPAALSGPNPQIVYVVPGPLADKLASFLAGWVTGVAAWYGR
jgi:hypothetical protein